ncbi:MAG: GH3 auxin-responsive promoter family protein [Bacteroidaceae bacterium]|nr:GH3 auxin-responsive promoter family protein [Bacteroidaceae bacterium]
MNLTPLAKPIFNSRVKKIARYATQTESIQRSVLKRLLAAASGTEWGIKHGYSSISSYEKFAQAVGVQDYESLKGYIDRMRHGEKDVLWKGRCKWFAKSSGTTNDKSKFIPVTPTGLQNAHYKGGFDVVAQYVANNPKSRIFSGKGLILGGSHAVNYNLPGSLVGDLSAILIENCSPFVNFMRVPGKDIALLSDFEEKMEKIARATCNLNVTNLSGVPSWMMAVLKHMLNITGKQGVEELWPNLEVFFHGGVAFTPYREQYLQLIRKSDMKYMETYNASEGFFGIQNDPTDPAMLLMIDYDIFYEFIPFEEFDSPNPTVVPLWEVEVGKNYAMLISTSCGLWRYMIGDTVRFTSKDPYKIVISGRTKHFINAFGEELMVDNAEKGLQKACAETGAQVLEYTAAPVFMDANAQCRHQWLIEFAKQPQSIEQFTDILDSALQQINSDYEAKRYKNKTMQKLEIMVARKNLFNDWLKGKGKLGGQHKVPRLSNSRQYIEELMLLNNSNETI